MATDNPYSPPGTAVAGPPVEVPDEVLKKIRRAWIAALVSAGFTLVVTLIALSGVKVLDFSAWELFDVAFIAGMAYGIYRRSRICAVLMLLYFIASKVIISVTVGRPSGLAMGLVFAYFFWQGVVGTFEYHKLEKQQQLHTASRG